ncbi:MAG: recombination protein RecR, partial [Bacilli bacterium]|nr:recombination protein RecR [Bacilli bacterium]
MKELRSLTELIESFSKLPGVGVKSAERMAYAVLRMKEEDRDDFVKAIKDVSSNIHPCPVCGLYTEDEKCEICANPARNKKTICVVSEAKDALAIEKMNSFDGVFHVLGGVVSPSHGIGPDDLNIKSLLDRVKEFLRDRTAFVFMLCLTGFRADLLDERDDRLIDIMSLIDRVKHHLILDLIGTGL